MPFTGDYMEKAINPNRSVAIVGDYNPLPDLIMRSLSNSARLSTTSEKKIFYIYLVLYFS